MTIHSVIRPILRTCEVLVALAVLYSIGGASAQASLECERTSLGVPFNTLNLQAFGQYVIWVDFQWDDTGTHDYTIHIYDTQSGVEETIQLAVGHDTVPDFADGRLVWTGPDYDYGEVYLYDLNTRAISQLSDNDGTSAFTPPRINGHYVYWITQQDDTHRAIVRYNLDTAEKQYLRLGEFVFEPQAKMDGNTLVWVDFLEGQSAVIRYDVSTDTVTQLTTDSQESGEDSVSYHSPQISGDLIVWQRETVTQANGGQRIFEWFLSDGTETRLIANSSSSLTLNTPYVVWSEGDENDAELFLHNVETDTPMQITDNDFPEYVSQITDDQVIWSNFDEGIYLYDIPTGETIVISDSQYVGGAQSGDGFFVWREGIDLHGGNAVLCMYEEG